MHLIAFVTYICALLYCSFAEKPLVLLHGRFFVFVRLNHERVRHFNDPQQGCTGFGGVLMLDYFLKPWYNALAKTVLRGELMKRWLAMVLVLAMCLSLCSCGKGNNASTLQGKKVLFVGCSFTYYGGTVCPDGDSTTGTNYSSYTQEEREHDNGFFYQLCKARGVEVNVTDWTFGGHNLKNILGGSRCRYSSACQLGSENGHLADLTNRNFDYVILNEIRRDGESPEEICDSIEQYANIFKEANPSVRIYYIVHDGVYVSGYDKTWLQAVELIEDLDITVLDWGTLVWDVANGNVEVPEATQEYRKNTFMVSQQKDRYHPNILTGYLYAAMTYCAITGDSAVGLPNDFCFSPENEAYPISARYDIDTYKAAFYTYDDPNTEFDERETNFDTVLASKSDMKGLQKLLDMYVDPNTKAWKKHLK